MHGEGLSDTKNPLRDRPLSRAHKGFRTNFKKITQNNLKSTTPASWQCPLPQCPTP